MRIVRNKTVSTCALALLAVLVFAWSTLPAWAEGENVVNPQQLPDSSFIYDTTIGDLAAADAYFDNQTVQITGEAVGDLIEDIDQPGWCWVEVGSRNAASNATVAVWMSRANAEKIDTFGKYGTTGTMLQVRGTFHLVCPEHTGISDLHADYVSVADRGKQHPDTFEPQNFIPGGIVIGLGIVVLGVFYFVRERQR
ncbi:MAG: hydrolase [Raoultibacter sp.]